MLLLIFWQIACLPQLVNLLLCKRAILIDFLRVVYLPPPVLEPWLEQLPGQQLLQLEVSLLPERLGLPVLLQTWLFKTDLALLLLCRQYLQPSSLRVHLVNLVHLGNLESLEHMGHLGNLDSLVRMGNLGNLELMEFLANLVPMEIMGGLENMGSLEIMGSLENMGSLGNMGSLENMEVMGLMDYLVKMEIMEKMENQVAMDQMEMKEQNLQEEQKLSNSP